MPIANYLECGSQLKLKIELSYPLRSVEDIRLKKFELSREVWTNLMLCLF